MSQRTLSVDSRSMGDPSRHHTLIHLEEALMAQRSAPKDNGHVGLIVRKVEGGLRQTPQHAHFTPSAGFPGDAWGRAADPDPEAQLTVMELDVATLIANGQPLTLFGDNLIFDLDLSAENLPIGTTLRAGKAILTVTPKPHNGCKKFNARFGSDALCFVSKPELRHRNLRGIYMRVLEAGEIAVGDVVQVLARV